MARIASAIDFSQVGAIGHSTGGLVAVAACQSDRRVRACVDMDGGVASPDQQPMADFVSSGVTKPTLFLRSQPLYDDTTLLRRHMTREQWSQRGEDARRTIESLASRSTGSMSVVQVAGAGHFNFSDAPFVMPSAITRFGGRIIAPDRGWTLITTVVRSFFDHELRRQGAGLPLFAAQSRELTLIAQPTRGPVE